MDFKTKKNLLATTIGLLISLPTHANSVNWVGATDFWDVSNDWNPSLPGLIDDVIINVPGVQTITVRSGSYKVNTVNVAGDEILAVSGGSLTINGASNLVKYNQSGGTLAGSGTVKVSGAAIWSGGTQTDGGTTQINGSLAINGNDNKYLLNGRKLENKGITTWNAPNSYPYGAIYAEAAAAINNNGTWIDENSYTHQINGYGGAASSFNNNGVYTKNGNGSTTIGIGFNNTSSGAINVNAGVMQLSAPITNQGVMSVASGAVINVQNTAFKNEGTLQGNGTYQTLNATTAIVNDGSLAPGIDGIGSLTISGDYTQTSKGYFDIQLSSLTNYDKLNVLGDISLAGTLRVHSLSGYTPIVGNSFTIASFNDRIADFSDLTGIFTNIVWSGFDPGVSFTASYLDHSIVLNAISAPVPVPTAALLFGSGILGLVGSMRRKQKIYYS